MSLHTVYKVTKTTLKINEDEKRPEKGPESEEILGAFRELWTFSNCSAHHKWFYLSQKLELNFTTTILYWQHKKIPPFSTLLPLKRLAALKPSPGRLLKASAGLDQCGFTVGDT